MRRLTLLLICIAAGCGSPKIAPSTKAQAPADPWSVTTTDPSDPTPAYLSNGLIGIRIGRDGTCNGQSLFDIDEYDRTGEERIRELQIPFELAWTAVERQANGPKPLALSLDLANVSDYSQKLDFRSGLLLTSWKATFARYGSASVNVETVLHPSERMLGIRCLVVPESGEYFPEVQQWHGADKFLNRDMPLWLLKGSLAGTNKPFVQLEVEPGWFERTPGKLQYEAEWVVAFGNSIPPGKRFPPRFSELFESARERRDESCDIEIDGPVEDQQAIRSFLYYLRSSIHPLGRMSVSPFGLSSSLYNGHVFWDADVWVFPALALIDPDRAKSIIKYRQRTFSGAQENFRAWLANGRPTATSSMGKGYEDGGWGPPGVMFAWESSVSGKEAIPSHFRFQHHVTGSVVWSAEFANTLGFIENGERSDFARGAAHFYDARMTKGLSGYEIKDTMSPDENHIGDNDLYTNLVAQAAMDDGVWWKAPPEQKPKLHLKLPKDSRTFLNYDNDEERTYQQTAALLSVYPLQFPPAEMEARKMLERFEPLVSKNGPAMSESIHATIWARLGERERAYQTWKTSWKDFTNHPLLLFSEKRKTSTPLPPSSSGAGGGGRTYFVTGAAGCLQTVIYGFLGFRIDDKPQPGAAWSTPLKNGKVLSIKPNLPPAWKKATFRNFSVLGKRYTLTVTQTGAKVLAEK